MMKISLPTLFASLYLPSSAAHDHSFRRLGEQGSFVTQWWIIILVVITAVVITGAVSFMWWRRRERLLRAACADMLQEYMPMEDNAQISVPLYRANVELN
mmetsp:Transcript_32283/g.37902  ORF Transcript_32283/g.37902 Transcript_32283/m.37902 type:complete len:100 (-) Transcript_32283:139-438(-)